MQNAGGGVARVKMAWSSYGRNSGGRTGLIRNVWFEWGPTSGRDGIKLEGLGREKTTLGQKGLGQNAA